MMVGMTIMISATVLFGLGRSYAVLVAARSIQGVGSACTGAAGMAMIAMVGRNAVYKR